MGYTAEDVVDLRAEVDRLHRYIRRQWAAVAAAEAGAQVGAQAATATQAAPAAYVSPAAQAWAVLGQAQEIADWLVPAERLAGCPLRTPTERARVLNGSNRLRWLARGRYQDVVVRAHQRADRAAELALEQFEQQNGRRTGTEAGRARAELEVKAAYLRTFAKVCRVALRAVLDVTAREFDRLLGASASTELEVAAGIRAGRRL